MWCYFMIHQKISFNLPLHLQIRCELEFPAVIVIQDTKDLDHPVFDVTGNHAVPCDCILQGHFVEHFVRTFRIAFFSLGMASI